MRISFDQLVKRTMNNTPTSGVHTIRVCNLFGLLALFIIIAIFGACNKQTPQPHSIAQQLIAESVLEGYTIAVYSDDSKLSTGYNKLYIRVQKEDEKPLKDKSQLRITPIMDMHEMSHSCPFIEPKFRADLGLFEAAAVFTMPSGSMGDWHLELLIDNKELRLPIQVHPLSEDVKFVSSNMGTDGTRYITALVEPAKPKIGMNDLKILIFAQHSHHHFEAVNDLHIEMTPEMPSMGHGSPNNINPSAIGDGFYAGKVNFTMTGDWKINLRLKREDQLIVENAHLNLWF